MNEPRPGPDESPEKHLAWHVARLRASTDPDAAALELGCGELEGLLDDHEAELWPEIERLARTDPVFRRALQCAWAYDSPMFDQREKLLEEVGEWRPTWVRFVAYPTRLGHETPLAWRAIELEGSVRPKDLAPLLRSMADWAERQEDPPEPG